MDDQDARAYLLGQPTSADPADFELRYLAGGEEFERLLAAEDQLAHERVLGRLNAADQRQFDDRLAPLPRVQASLRFARLQAALAQRSKIRQWTAWSGAAAALIVIAVPAWWQVFTLQRELESARASRAAAPTETRAVLPVEVAFVLRPGRIRASGPTPVITAPGGAAIRFELILPPGNDAGQYVAAFHRSGSAAPITSQTTATANGVARITVPAGLLPTGDYDVQLSRLQAGEPGETLAVYAFRRP